MDQHERSRPIGSQIDRQRRGDRLQHVGHLRQQCLALVLTMRRDIGPIVDNPDQAQRSGPTARAAIRNDQFQHPVLEQIGGRIDQAERQLALPQRGVLDPQIFLAQRTPFLFAAHPQQVPDTREQPHLVDWLGEEVVRARHERLVERFGVVGRGKHQDWQVARALGQPHPRADFQPVDIGHHDVEDN